MVVVKVCSTKYFLISTLDLSMSTTYLGSLLKEYDNND